LSALRFHIPFFLFHIVIVPVVHAAFIRLIRQRWPAAASASFSALSGAGQHLSSRIFMNVHNHSIWPPPLVTNSDFRHMLLSPACAWLFNLLDQE